MVGIHVPARRAAVSSFALFMRTLGQGDATPTAGDGGSP
jgi:hypothetical protein